MRKNKKIVLSVVSIVATVVAMFSLVLTLLKHENPNTSSVQNAEVFVEDSKNTSEQQVTIEIADTTFSGSGTHIKIKNNETYNVTNCTFVGATDSAIILEGGTLNLSGSKFEDCAGFEGGAIYSESAGTLNITNSTFENCDATENGGSIGSHGANITIDKSTFQNCGADCGGAIYAMGSGAIDIRSTMFVSNDAISGGAIYTDLEKFTIDKDLTDDEDCTQILNCSAADGGGLFLFPTTVLCMYDGVFAGNTASGSGGSVYVDCGTIIMYGGAIWGNGVDADDDGIIDSNNNDEPFTNAVSGGAVYVSNGTMSMYGGVIEGNVASDLDKSLSSNDYHGGGGICLLNSDFTMTGGSVVGNTIHEYGRATKRHGGGGIAAFSSSVTISGTTTKIEDNNAFGYFAYTTATTYGGGGIYTYLGDFTMTGGSVKDNESKILGEIAGTGSGQHIRAYGGGIYCGSKTATISGVTIENNESHNRGGGLFFVDSGSSIFNVLGNSSVINNKSVSNAGGGIAGGGGTMNIGSQNDVENSVIIEGNYSRFIGAGVFLSGTRLNMYSGKIIGNSADQQGGGIGVTSNAIMNLYGGEISENKAASGGGIFINVVDQSKISKVENVTLSGNVSVNGNGHEISVTTASLQLSNVEINSKENGTFENLDYGKNYSVIHNSGGVLSILDDSSIKNEISGCKNLLYATNSASVNLRNCDEIWHFGSGYAFSLSNGCNFEIDGGDSKKAYVDHNGNGFIEFVDGNNLKVNNYMISNCKVSAILASCIVDEDNTNGIVELSNIEIKDGTGTNGGAIYLNNVDKCYLTNGKISDCSSTNGGAVYALNSKLEIDAVVTTCTADYGAGIYATGSEMLISDTISNCQATYGGGLYCTNTSVILAGTISGCKATFEGGAISSYSGTIDISGQILDCDLSLDDGNVKGGAMYVYKGSLAINGTGCVLDDTSTHTISGCDSSGYGGAIFLDDVDDVDLNSGVISNCTSGSGGAVFSRSSDIGFEEDYGYFVVSNCVATVNGGAFCLEDYSTLELSDKATVDGCSATTNGGAVYAKSSDVFLSGGISGCVASNLGGGIFVNSGTLKMTTGEISGCTANHGAGIYATSLTTIEIGCQILDCVATHYGGGMFVESSTLNLSGMINNCSSGSHGGGIHIKYGTLDASNATISACSAETSYGGGIYSQYSNISAIGAELLNCNATRGGGIYAISNSGNGVKDIDLDAVTISNCDCNVDGGRGGGIFANFVNINVDAGSKISGCDATENGGGLFAESTIKDSDGKTLPCKVVLSGEGTEVSGCVAQQGGGVFVSKSSFEMNAGVCLLNNIGKTTVTKDDAGNVLSTREGYGGGLYLGDLGFGNFSNCSAYIYGGLIQGNEATRGAGIYVVSAKVSMGTDENTPTTVLITKNITDTAGGGICVRGTSVVDYYGMNFGDNLRNNNYGIVDNIIRYKADSSRSWVGRGAGVYLLGDYAFFNMYNGNISGNIIDGDTVNNDTGAEQMPSVNAQGAAMFVTANSGFVMKGGIVSGNIIETCESNYRISAGGVMSIYSGGYAI
ncbi:MAG: hypothetical protein IJW24_00830, partial [Clostridia bacterium]|nr:hypothetical protein [Clostridia bacterium]